jgi:hypothetical protein
MPADEWIQSPEVGSILKFTYQELPREGALVTAQTEGNEVVYSIVIDQRAKPSESRTGGRPVQGRAFEEVATV